MVGTRGSWVFAVAALAATLSHAQGAGLAFSSVAIDPELPVEVAADQLSVNQADGAAVFSGNVTVAQGAMRMSADRVEIEYVEGQDGARTRIDRLIATGDVLLVTPEEEAEAQEAIYAIADGTVVMSGDVLLTQGPNALSGDRLTIDLETGTGSLEGRVRTILQSGGGN